MAEPAKPFLAANSARHDKTAYHALKRAVKNALFPLPGVRKFLIASRQKLDHVLYVAASNKAAPLFQNAVQPGRPRAMVVSIPKSGTYLLHALLKELGFIASNVHLGESGYYDQREERTDRQNFGEVKIDAPLTASAKRIGEGQVTAGHLLYLPDSVKTLRDFRIFFTYRETRATFVSYMRYFSKPGHGDEFGTAWKNEADEKKRMARFLKLYAPSFMLVHFDILGWLKHDKALPVKFEALVGDEGEAAQIELVKKIALHVGVTLDDAQAKEFIGKALGGGSRTWSGERSSLPRYWSDESEQIFLKTGGQRLNQALGYR